MRIEEKTVADMKRLRVVHYKRPAEIAEAVRDGDHTQWYINENRRQTDWTGSTFDVYQERSLRGDTKYARKAEKFVEKFANIALEAYDITNEYNTANGVLDYHAAMAGDPMCMFGPTLEKTVRAPVQVYLDQWTSWTVTTEAMIMRGVSVIAFAMALSVFRPVRVRICTGLRHSPTGWNNIQIIDVPTAPIDLSMAAWMLGDPAFFRWGLLPMTFNIAGSSALCGIPCLSNQTWQTTKMGEWLAREDGVDDCVFLPLMMDNGQWQSQEYCIGWVKRQLSRFGPQPE